jgi:hypothetical protein
VSGDGQIVIGYNNDSPTDGWFWTKRTGVVFLKDYLKDHGFVSNYTCFGITGISGDGKAICGTLGTTLWSDGFVATLELPPYVSSQSAPPAVGGAVTHLSIQLSAPVLKDTAVGLTSATSLVQLPASVTIPKGSSSIVVPIQSQPVPADTTVVIDSHLLRDVVEAKLLLKSASLASVVVPHNVPGGRTATCAAYLNGATSASGATVALSSSNPAVASVPAQVLVPAGAKATTFAISTHPVYAETGVTLTGTYKGLSRSTTVYVERAALASLTASPWSVHGGQASVGKVTLDTIAPAGGVLVYLSSSNTSVVPLGSAVAVPAGTVSAQFPIKTNGVDASTSVTLSASRLGVVKTAVLNLAPAALLSASVQPSSVIGGSYVALGVTLLGSAGPAGLAVALASNSAAAKLPSTVFFSPNQSYRSVTVTTSKVATTTAVQITASARALAKSAALQVTP